MNNRVQILLNHLERNTDFNIAPSSASHHGAYAGGLRDHSWNVVNQLMLLTMRNHLVWGKPDSHVIVGLAHDMCKLHSYYRDEHGLFYKGYSADTRHAAKSVELVKQIIDITEEEEMCIRWHMGAFDDKENWSKYSDAVRQYPNVLWTHQADMISAHLLERSDLHLCMKCVYHPASCDGNGIVFGNGCGADNIIGCASFEDKFMDKFTPYVENDMKATIEVYNALGEVQTIEDKCAWEGESRNDQ